MFDHVIESIIESASPLITKWRVLFCFLSLVCMSPHFYLLFETSFYKQNIKEFCEKIAEIILATNAWIAILIVITIVHVMPAALSSMLKILSQINIKKASPLIDQLIGLRKKSRNEIESLVATSFDFWKSKSMSATANINAIKEYCEVFSLITAFYITTSSYLAVFNWSVAVATITVFLVAVFFGARKILILYLRDIAPFRVLEDYLKYIILSR